MIKFPSISQFRNVIRHVKTQAQFVGKDENGDAIYDASKPLPTLKFRGTVKLHGTNAGIVYDYNTKDLSFQSRERELTLTSDNAGFMLAQLKNETMWREYFEMHRGLELDKMVVFGEWCGSGIQKGVAISQLPKMFVIFAAKAIYTDGETEWLEVDYDQPEEKDIPGVHEIEDFETYEIDIDFNYPELAQNKMIELTLAVEKECPVGKHFGVYGIGEGIVYRCVTPGWEDSGTWMKIKGEAHSTSKVRTLAAVDVEAVATIKSFVDSVVTEARLEQGLDNLVREQLKPLEMSSMGDFLRWIYNDVMKEEQDVLIASQIDPKKLGSAIANVARPWYVKKLNEGTGL